MISKYINIGIGILIVALSISSYYLYNKTINLNNEVSILMSNQKAFIEENSILKNDNRVFKFTIDQLEYYNDSILEEMNNVRKELKIKDKDLKQIQYLLSQAQKTDTIRFRDTLFIDKTLQLDTLIGDEWYNIRLGLQYPNLILILLCE